MKQAILISAIATLLATQSQATQDYSIQTYGVDMNTNSQTRFGARNSRNNKAAKAAQEKDQAARSESDSWMNKAKNNNNQDEMEKASKNIDTDEKMAALKKKYGNGSGKWDSITSRHDKDWDDDKMKRLNIQNDATEELQKRRLLSR